MSNPDKVVYLYQHVPKCGGTSFRTVCAHYFTEVREIIPDKSDPEAREAFKNQKVDFENGPDNLMVTGHFIQDGFRPPDRYGAEIAKGNVRLITILRDPLARVISGYFYAIQEGRALPMPIERRLVQTRNSLCKFLGCNSGGDLGKFLDRYALVGIVEYLQPTVDLLALSMGKEPIEVPRVNVTTEKKKETFPPEILEKFRKNNARDYELFDLAVKRFRVRYLEETGRELPDLVLR